MGICVWGRTGSCQAPEGSDRDEISLAHLSRNQPSEVLVATLLFKSRRQRVPHLCKVLEAPGLICQADHDNDRRMPFMATCVSRWVVYVPSYGVVFRDPTW